LFAGTKISLWGLEEVLPPLWGLKGKKLVSWRGGRIYGWRILLVKFGRAGFHIKALCLEDLL